MKTKLSSNYKKLKKDFNSLLEGNDDLRKKVKTLDEEIMALKNEKRHLFYQIATAKSKGKKWGIQWMREAFINLFKLDTVFVNWESLVIRDMNIKKK